jgi:hypothetical protein
MHNIFEFWCLSLLYWAELDLKKDKTFVTDFVYLTFDNGVSAAVPPSIHSTNPLKEGRSIILLKIP